MISTQDGFASIIDKCLDMVLSGETTLDEVLKRFPEQADVLRSYLETALWIEHHKQVFNAPSGLKASQKTLFLQSLPSHPQKAYSGFWEDGLLKIIQSLFSRRTLQLAGSLALVIILLFSSSAGLVLAARNSIPGDFLYQPKISIEKAALFFSIDDTHDAELLIEFTDRRLFEVESVIQQNRLSYLPGTLQRYGQQVDQTLNEMQGDQAIPQAEKARLALKLAQSLENHSVLIDALSRTLPENYQTDLALTLSVTQESIFKATEILSQSESEGASSDQAPLASQTATNATRSEVSTTKRPLTTISPSLTPTESSTPLPLILPVASSTPTPPPTLSATLSPTDKPGLKNILPTRKPTKTPRIKPTRNPHFTPPADD